MWDDRYAEPGYAYGTAPNDFLVSVADRIPPGPVLCLAEGQGRNAVFLARSGRRVVAVDQSEVGLARAHELARSQGVVIESVAADLADYEIRTAFWAGIVSIWAHVPSSLRRDLHRRAVRGLRPGGAFVLEAYTPAQIGRGTGGPPVSDRTMDLDSLRRELQGLDLQIARELERDVHEGRYHGGLASVVQVLGFRVP